MNENAGEFAGLTQEEANERIVERLREQGLLEKQEPYRHAVGHCDRCGTRIEPLITLQWWVKMKPLAEPAAQAIRDGRVALHAGAAERRRAQLARQHPRLVHLAPDLVGPPDPGLVLPGRPHDGGRVGARRVRRVRLDRAPAGRRRARHVVLVRALAVRDARLAGRRRPTSRILSERRQRDRPRDHLPLGGADDHVRARAHGPGALPRRDHPLDDPRARRPPHVEEPRHGDRSARRDRLARRGRDALRAAEDVVDAGRPLQRRDDRGGPQAREQALERRAADPHQRRRREARRASDERRGALDPRAARRSARATSSASSRRSTSRAR